MPINFNLEKLRRENNCSYYFETGLGDSKNIKSYKVQSCLQAVRSKFNKIYSMEIEKRLIDLGIEAYKSEIENERVTLIHDDSKNIGKYLDDNILDKKTLFFLDAHHRNSKTQLPIIHELNEISKLKNKNHIICIDDIRLLKGKKAWGLNVQEGYDSHLDHILSVLSKINNKYKIKYLKGIKENDVLCAYL